MKSSRMIIIVCILAMCGISVLIGVNACKNKPVVCQKSDSFTKEMSAGDEPSDSHQVLVLTENQHILETDEYVLDTWEKLRVLTKIDFSGIDIQNILYYKDEEDDGTVLIVVFNDVQDKISSYYRGRDLYFPDTVKVSPGITELLNYYHIDPSGFVSQSIDFAEVVHKYSYTILEAASKFHVKVQDIDPQKLNGYEHVPYEIDWFQLNAKKDDKNCMIVVTYPFAIKVGGVFLDYIDHSQDKRR